MTFAILLSRASQAIHYQGIVRVASTRGHTIRLILDQRLSGGPKDDQVPTLERLPKELRGLGLGWATSDPISLVRALGNPSHDAVLWTYMPGITATVLRQALGEQVKLCHVQATFSDVIGLRASLRDYDAVFGWSENWVSWWEDFRRVTWPEGPSDLVEHLRRIWVSVGPPIRDLLLARTPDAWPRLVYLPFPSASLSWHWWSHGCYAGRGSAALGLGEARLVRALRGYANRRRLRFTIKGRRKNPIPRWMARLADEVVYGDSENGIALLNLLTDGAVLLVHHLSTSVVEAALAEVPAVCVSPPIWRVHPGYQTRLRHPDFAAPAQELSSSLGGSFYDYGDSLRSLSPQAAVDLFRNSSVAPWSSSREWRAYRKTFLGEYDRPAGELMVEHLEAICKS